MSFDDLPARPPVYPREAEAYARDALTLSRRAAARVRACPDLSYGDDYWQKLDIYLPDDAAPGADLPVLLFAHGGAWTHGYKEWMGLMAPALVATPAILVSVSYRLAPECRFPGPLEDCVAALAWVHRHIGEYGGDPGRLFVGGHSAGGHLYTLASLQPARLARAGLPAGVIRGCMAICSQLNLVFEDPPAGSGEARIYEQFLARAGDDRAASPLHQLPPDGAAPPFLLVHGENDFPRIIASNRRMLAALKRHHLPVRFQIEPGASHFDVALRLADPQCATTATLRAWLRDGPSGFEPFREDHSVADVVHPEER